jgi:hypothetical protein
MKLQKSNEAPKEQRDLERVMRLGKSIEVPKEQHKGEVVIC